MVFLNWSVFNKAKIFQGNTIRVRVGTHGHDSAEGQWQRRTKSMIYRKAAVDVSIIIGAFVLCYVPGWITVFCRQYLKSRQVPAEVVLVTSSVFFVSSLCNPIIYSIRKRKFRTGVQTVLRRAGICRGSHRLDKTIKTIGMNNLTLVPVREQYALLTPSSS